MSGLRVNFQHMAETHISQSGLLTSKIILDHWMRNIFISLHGQILMTEQLSSILLNTQEYKMKIRTVPMPKLNWQVCVAFTKKPPKRMHRHCFYHYNFMLGHLWNGFGGYCTSIEGYVYSDVHDRLGSINRCQGCRRTIQISLNCWRLLSRRYCPEESTTNETQSIPLF